MSECPFNEYPRPQLKRNSFFNLNGKWELDGKEITVPYPPQSKLSGYTGKIRKTFYIEKTSLYRKIFQRGLKMETEFYFTLEP